MRKVLGSRRAGYVGYRVLAIVLAVALGMVSLLTAGPASAAARPAQKAHPFASFSMDTVVGTRQSDPDACGLGLVAGTNCTTTIVVHGTDLPTADPSTIGIEENGDSTPVAVIANDDCTFFCGDHVGWKAGHDTDSVTTCDVIVGLSTATTLIFEVGDLGGACPGYAIEPGASLQVILYNSDGSQYDSETTTSTTPGGEPAVSDVNPPTGPQSGGTDAEPGTGSVTVTTSGTDAPEAVWFTNPSGLTGATGIATDNFSQIDATHYSVVPPDSGPQGDEGIVVEVADSANGTSPQACAVLLPDGCADEYMYMSEHSDTFGPSDPFNFDWSDSLGSAEAEGSSDCGGTSAGGGVSGDLSISGSVTGGGIGLTAHYGVSQSELDFPETLVGSATLTVASPIVINVTLTGTISACEQIPIPDLNIPDVAGFYFVVGGEIKGTASLTITINQGTYTLGGSFIPGSNADDITGATVGSDCVDGSGNPTTNCVTTALSASLQGTLTVSPLWLSVGPSFANVGAGMTAAATGIITYPPLAVDGDICVAGQWNAQVDIGPLQGSKNGNWLGPINLFGDGSICPLGSTTGSSANAPDAPGNLTASNDDSSSTLSWDPPTSDGGSPITGYNVYEGTSPGGESTTPVNASPLAADATSYPVTGLTNGTTYYFTVTAINDVDEGAASNEASATPAGAVKAPGAHERLKANAGKGEVRLKWSAPKTDGGSAITGYNVYEGTTSGGESATPVNASPLPATPTSFVVTGLTNDTPYFFTVKAVNDIGEGGPSNEATATPRIRIRTPGIPGRVRANPQNGAVKVKWRAPASVGGIPPILGYNVYVGTSPGGESATPVNASPLPATPTSFIVTGLTNGTTYYFTVTALNSIGEGTPSTEVSATPATTPPTPAPNPSRRFF